MILLSYFMVALAALISGIVLGRSDLREERQKQATTISSHGLYIVWRNPNATRKS